MSDVHPGYDNPHHHTPSNNRMGGEMKGRNNKDSPMGDNKPTHNRGMKRKSNNNPGINDNEQNERPPKNVYNGGVPGMHRLTGAPTWNLEPQNLSSMTFTGRCRLFVANLPQNVTEESLRTQFSEFGQVSEIFIGKGNQFAFIKMDTRANADAAKNALDGKITDGRSLRVRLAAHPAAIKVSNLPPCVSNELLHLAFSSFGLVERAIVIADDRGRSLNEGIVEFQRKTSALAAIKKCQNEPLLLSLSPLPVMVTSFEARDEEEGVPEKNVIFSSDYGKEREVGPRFSEPGSVEYEIASKWKQFFQIEAQRREAFEAEMKDMQENFRAKMEYFKLEETTKQLREQIRQMENRTQQFSNEQEMRRDYERQRDEERRQQLSMLRAKEEQLLGPAGPVGPGGLMSNGADMNNLRRQENELRQHASALQMLLDRQESTYRSIGSEPSAPPPHQMDQYNQQNMQNSNIPNLNPVAAPPPSQMNPYGHPPPPQQQAPAYGSPHVQQQPPPPGMMPPHAGPQHRPHPPMPYGNGQQMPPQQYPQSSQQQPPPLQQQYHQNMGNGNMQNLNNGGYGKRNRNRY